MKRTVPLRSLLQLVLIGVLAGCYPTPAPSTTIPSPTRTEATPPLEATQSINLSEISSTPTPAGLPVIASPTSAGSTSALPTQEPSGKLELPGQKLTGLAIDDQDAYWVTDAEPQKIYRAPLTAGSASTPEQVVKSRFLTGSLAAQPILVQGDWLVFLDQAFNATNPVWRLRAFNLNSHQDKVLAEAGGNFLARIYSFSTDGSQVAWIIEDHNPSRACTEESSLVVATLSDGRATTLDRSCVNDDRQWNSVQISDARVIASVTSTKGDSKTSVYYWSDLQADPQPLSEPFPGDQPSTPVLGADWAAWQSAPGTIRLVRLDGSENRVLTSPEEGGVLAGPVFVGKYLAWLPTPDVLLYQLEGSVWQALAAPHIGEQIDLVANGPNRIAWSRTQANGGQSSSTIEWVDLN